MKKVIIISMILSINLLSSCYNKKNIDSLNINSWIIVENKNTSSWIQIEKEENNIDINSWNINIKNKDENLWKDIKNNENINTKIDEEINDASKELEWEIDDLINNLELFDTKTK